MTATANTRLFRNERHLKEKNGTRLDAELGTNRFTETETETETETKIKNRPEACLRLHVATVSA
jgi:hypothetical protein